MKKLIALIALLLTASLVTPASANTNKTLVIIDSGINSQLPWVKSILVEEACFIEFGRCPNGQASMVGPGAASLNGTDGVTDRSFNHGTQMASVAYAVNPNVKLIMIRIVGRSDKGFANSYTTRAVTQALDWVAANTSKYNIGAVSISLGRTYTEAACPIESPLQQRVIELKQANVAVFTASGNKSLHDRVDYPACIPEMITVGATDRRYAVRGVTGWVYPIMANSNGNGSQVDVFALGRYTTTLLNGTTTVSLGTSNATAAVASRWTQLASGGLTYDSVWSNMQSTFENAYRSLSVVYQLQYNL